MNIWQILTKPASSITDTRQVRNARFLSIFTLALILIFLGFMIVNAVTIENYRVPPADYIGYAFLFLIYFLSRTRFYWVGIAMIIAMMPLNTYVNILQGTTSNPANTINFLVVTYVLAGIFLSTTWTAVISFIVVASIWFFPNIAPETIPDLSVIIQPFTVNIITALLVIVSMDHRNRIERARQEEIQTLNESLEKRVEERTAELAAANKELESFCYSVSHDLRAPLRAISGLSALVLEENDKSVGEETDSYLHRIDESARKMDSMINGLLDLSRISRESIDLDEVNLSELAKDIIADLPPRDSGRECEFNIAENITVHGDERLLRILMLNLINNAWKFTRECGKAVIEISSKLENGQQIIYVKDNGAGFDDAYAENLFAPFQRLHTESEYEGDGIGLATCRKIVQCHGGDIWAEAKPGEGATFFFTLG